MKMGNWLSYLAILVTLLTQRGGAFTFTVGTQHLSLAVVDLGSGGVITHFNFNQALALAGLIIAGTPGQFEFRLGADVYQATLTLV